MHEQEKKTSIPGDKKPGEGQPWPEPGKQGGQGDVGKKGGDLGRVPDQTGEVGKKNGQ